MIEKLVKNILAKSLWRTALKYNCSDDFVSWCKSALREISMRLTQQTTSSTVYCKRLFSKHDAWVVFFSDNCDDNFWG